MLPLPLLFASQAPSPARLPECFMIHAFFCRIKTPPPRPQAGATPRISFATSKAAGAIFWICALALGIAQPNITHAQTNISQSEATPGTPPLLTVFMVDGLSAQVFERLLAAKQLPNIARMIQEGTYVQRGIAAFPSMTAYGFYPYVTGHDAAESGILGLRWFDRTRAQGQLRAYVGRSNRALNTDLRADVATLYEHVAPAFTATFNTYMDRGVHTQIKTGLDFTLAKYRNVWWLPRWISKIPHFGPRLIPTLAEVEARVMQMAIDQLPKVPKVHWLTLVSPDTAHHIEGFGPHYDSLIRNIDALIGAYRTQSQALGQEDGRIYALLTDHGLRDAQQNLDLVRVLQSMGLRAHREPSTSLTSSELDTPATDYANIDASVVINGNMLNYLYLKSPRMGWGAAPSLADLRAYPIQSAQSPAPKIDLIAKLLATPGVGMLIAPSPKPDVLAQVLSPKGHAEILGQAQAPQNPTYGYRILQGQDPLGYAQASSPSLKAMLGGALHPSRMWLAQTAAHNYPDALHRIAQLMRQPKRGDLVVMAAPGVDLGGDYELFVGDYKGGHGGLDAAQLRVPMVISGPNITQGLRIPTARAEDMGATLLTLMGFAPGQNARGQTIAGSIQSPKPSQPSQPSPSQLSQPRSQPQ